MICYCETKLGTMVCSHVLLFAICKGLKMEETVLNRYLTHLQILNSFNNPPNYLKIISGWLVF
jgi:hypothetical protein